MDQAAYGVQSAISLSLQALIHDPLSCGEFQVLVRKLSNYPDAWNSYDQCGLDFDGIAPVLLKMLQVVTLSLSLYHLYVG